MKNTIRVRQNRSTKPATKQVPAAGQTKQITPLVIVQEAEAALLNFERVGNAASALVMLNAEHIKAGVEDNAGWETLDVPGFKTGSLELGRIIVEQFQESLARLAAELRAKLNKIQNPGAATPGFSASELETSRCEDIENAVGSMRHCLITQSAALSDRSGDAIAHFASFALEEKLHAAFDAIWTAKNNVQRAFDSATKSEVAS